jgi:hypothetical protein
LEGKVLHQGGAAAAGACQAVNDLLLQLLKFVLNLGSNSTRSFKKATKRMQPR